MTLILSSRADLESAIQDLLDAGQAVLDSWESGDLAGAVNELRIMMDEARGVIEPYDTEEDDDPDDVGDDIGRE